MRQREGQSKHAESVEGCRQRVLKAKECSLNIPRHRDVNSACHVIPIEGQSAVLLAVPIRSDLVILLESRDEVLCSIGANVLDTEIIDTQGERDRECAMGE